jgi:hypothetical protein
VADDSARETIAPRAGASQRRIQPQNFAVTFIAMHRHWFNKHHADPNVNDRQPAGRSPVGDSVIGF